MVRLLLRQKDLLLLLWSMECFIPWQNSGHLPALELARTYQAITITVLCIPHSEGSRTGVPSMPMLSSVCPA
jgi:hypothetical protein